MPDRPSTASTYNSPIRDEQKGSTRRRILHALVRVMSNGPASVTIPAVAAEAGVSVPTVYRHFGDKEGLVDALPSFIGEMLQFDTADVPRTYEEIDEFIHLLFRRLDSADPLVRAALASGAAPQARKTSARERADGLAELFSELEPQTTDEDLERLSKILVILTCSDALRLWQDRFDVDADEAADYVIWAVERLAGASRWTNHTC